MGYIVIAPYGDSIKSLFVGIKFFPTEKIIFLVNRKDEKKIEKIKKKLNEFTIEVEKKVYDSNIMEAFFTIIRKLVNIYGENKIIINVSTGDKISSCAALSASYANGIKAFGIVDGKPMMLPIIRLCYYDELKETKLKILKEIENEFKEINEIAKKLKMSLPLILYHINGNRKFKGLKDHGLIEIEERENKLRIKASTIGKLILKGYIPFK